MTDTQIAADLELAASEAPPTQGEPEQRMPLAFIVFGCLAIVVQALWLGLIGRWMWVMPPVWRSAPRLYPGQALPRRLLTPPRSGVGADDAAAGADHPRPERRHRDVVRPATGAQHGLAGQSEQDTSRERTPSSRMLPSVIGSIS
jgi:hypothetical protein